MPRRMNEYDQLTIDLDEFLAGIRNVNRLRHSFEIGQSNVLQLLRWEAKTYPPQLGVLGSAGGQRC